MASLICQPGRAREEEKVSRLSEKAQPARRLTSVLDRREHGNRQRLAALNRQPVAPPFGVDPRLKRLGSERARLLALPSGEALLDRRLERALRRAGESDNLDAGAVRAPDILGKILVAEVNVLGPDEVLL